MVADYSFLFYHTWSEGLITSFMRVARLAFFHMCNVKCETDKKWLIRSQLNLGPSKVER